MDRKSITVVVAVVLGAVWIAYSFGWFDRSRPGTETQINSVSTNQALDQKNAKVGAAQVAHETAAPVDSATE